MLWFKKERGGGNSIRDREVLSNGSIKTSSLRATPCLNGRLEASATPSLQVVSVSLVLVPHPLQLPAAEGVYQTWLHRKVQSECSGSPMGYLLASGRKRRGKKRSSSWGLLLIVPSYSYPLHQPWWHLTNYEPGPHGWKSNNISGQGEPNLPSGPIQFCTCK